MSFICQHLHFLQGGNLLFLLFKFCFILNCYPVALGLHKQLTKTAHEAAVSLSVLVVLGTGSVL